MGDKCRFASPVVAVRQPGKTTRRVCGDYRAINDICLLHQAPVKDAREVTAQFKGAKYFGKADMYKGYFQLRLDEDAQELLAIRTPDALFFGKHIYRLRTPLTANDPDESIDPEPAQPLGGVE